MKKAKLLIDHEIITGGCNACATVKVETARLMIDDHLLTVDELTAEGLITTLTLHEGFRQEMMTEILDDYLLFSASHSQVKQIEHAHQWTYSNNLGVSLSIKKFHQNNSSLLEDVNRILVDVFGLFPIVF